MKQRGARTLLARVWRSIADDPAFVCGLAAAAVAIVAIWVSIAPHRLQLSTLVRMQTSDGVAEYAATDANWVYAGAHYDGIYFYAIALDPLALGRPHELIDLGANRYGHPAYGWAAGLLGRFDPRGVVVSLAVVSVLSMYVAGFAASRVSALLGVSPWFGLLIALNPGLIFAVTNDTSEAFGAALLCATLWAWLSGRIAVAAALIVPLCFAKEHLLLVPAGLLLFEAIAAARRRSVVGLGRRVLPLILGPAVYMVWLVVVHDRFGVWSFAEYDNLSLPVPLVGWLESLGLAANAAVGDYGSGQIGTASIALQVAVMAVLLLGLFRAVRFRTPVDAVFVMVAVLMCYLRWNQLFFPKDLIRGVAFALVLLPWVLAVPAATHWRHIRVPAPTAT